MTKIPQITDKHCVNFANRGSKNPTIIWNSYMESQKRKILQKCDFLRKKEPSFADAVLFSLDSSRVPNAVRARSFFLISAAESRTLEWDCTHITWQTKNPQNRGEEVARLWLRGFCLECKQCVTAHAMCLLESPRHTHTHTHRVRFLRVPF